MQNILRQKRLFFTIFAKNCSFLFHFFPRSVVSTAFAIASEVALLVPISTYFHRVSRVEKGRNTGGRRRAEEKSVEVHLSCHDYCWCYFYKQCFQPWPEYWKILDLEYACFTYGYFTRFSTILFQFQLGTLSTTGTSTASSCGRKCF